MSRSLFDLYKQTGEKAVKFLQTCRIHRVELIVTWTYRSFSDQAVLYAKGRKSPGRKVTNAMPGHSFHNVRRAIDVAFVGPNQLVHWDGDWKEIGQIGVDCGFHWGGNFETFVDRPHFEDRYCVRCDANHDKAMCFNESGECQIKEPN